MADADDKMAGPDKRPGQDLNRQAAFDLGRIENDNLGVPPELFPVAAGGLGNLLGQGAAPVRVVPEKPRNHHFYLAQMF